MLLCYAVPSHPWLLLALDENAIALRPGHSPRHVSVKCITVKQQVRLGGCMLSGEQWQHTDSGGALIYDHQCPGFELCLVLHKSGNDHGRQVAGEDILGSYLNHAWPHSAGDGQQCTKIEIVGKDDVAPCSCPRHNHVIRRLCIPDGRPVSRVPSPRLEHSNPIRREIHIDEQLHALLIGSSTSQRAMRHRPAQREYRRAPGTDRPAGYPRMNVLPPASQRWYLPFS